MSSPHVQNIERGRSAEQPAEEATNESTGQPTDTGPDLQRENNAFVRAERK